jgi:outer membrane protein
MGNRRKAGLLAAVFTSGFLALSATPALAETLAEAIALAYSTNPALLTQRANLRIADEQFYRAERQLSPTISADVSLTGGTDNDLRDSLRGASSSGVSAGINASQPIYTGGRITAGLKAQEAALQSQREALRQAEMTMIVSVVNAYTEVRRLEDTLRISRENVAVLQRQREEAQARFEVGQQTRTDVAQAESRLAGARTQLTTAENNLNNARERYRTVVGRMPEQLAPEPNLAQAVPPSRDQAFLVAEQNSPTLRQAYLDERASAAQIAVARAERRPQVRFQTGINADTSNTALAGGFSSTDAALTTGITLSVPLYTGLTTSSTIRSAQESNRRDNITIEARRRTLNETVIQQYNAVVANRANIVSQEEAVRAAQLAYEGTREEQQVGLRATLDVLNAEQDLRLAQQQLINAKFAEYTSMVGLLNAMGTLTPEIFGAEVDTYDPKAHFEEVNNFSLPWEPLVKQIDRIGAPAIPDRAPLPGENIPRQEPLR